MRLPDRCYRPTGQPSLRGLRCQEAVVNRQQHLDRVEAVNERMRGQILSFAFDLERALHRPSLMEESLDRLRYGDCNGFGAPQARRANEQIRR